MKLAVFGDLHYEAASPRGPHALEVLDAAIRDAKEHQATHFYFLGDVFEGAPSPIEYAEILQRIVDLPVVGFVRGNHEDFNAYRFFPLLGKHVAAADSQFVIDRFSDANVLLIPYPVRHRPPFDGLPDGTIAASLRAAAEKIAATVQSESVAAASYHRPLIVLGHFTIEGMTTRDTEFERHQANEVVVPVHAFDSAALTVVGHIHRAQELSPTVIGAGDLYRTSFSEADDPKSYVLVTIEQGHVTWVRRPTIARPLVEVAVELDAVTDDWLRQLQERAAGAEVKLVVSMDEEQAGRYDAAAFEGLGAEHLVLERVVRPKQRVRAPEIAVGMNATAQFAAWLRSTETVVDEARMERLLQKLERIA